MAENASSFQRLGELVLEEILVRSGIHQPHLPDSASLRVSLDFEVRADERDESVVVEGAYYDGTPYVLRLSVETKTG